MKYITVFGEEETETKYCPKCETNHPISEFRIRKEGRRDGGRLYTYCISCEKKINKELSENRKKAPPKPDACECCGKVTLNLVLDHDHDSGKIRGWICQDCNIGIGRLGDNINGLRAAISYLENCYHG